MAFAVYGMAVVVAPAIGPTLGGFITDNYSWRWIFYINVPIGIISLLLTSRLITDPPHLSGARREGGIKIDYIGLGLLALGLGTLQVVLDKGQRDDWFDSHFILESHALSPSLRWSRSFSGNGIQEHPIIDLKLFRDRSFAIGNSMMFMLGFVLLGTTLLLPLFTQTMLGYPAETGGPGLDAGRTGDSGVYADRWFSAVPEMIRGGS